MRGRGKSSAGSDRLALEDRDDLCFVVAVVTAK